MYPVAQLGFRPRLTGRLTGLQWTGAPRAVLKRFNLIENDFVVSRQAPLWYFNVVAVLEVLIFVLLIARRGTSGAYNIDLAVTRTIAHGRSDFSECVQVAGFAHHAVDGTPAGNLRLRCDIFGDDDNVINIVVFALDGRVCEQIHGHLTHELRRDLVLWNEPCLVLQPAEHCAERSAVVVVVQPILNDSGLVLDHIARNLARSGTLLQKHFQLRKLGFSAH